jgi:hypothetical protein
MRFDTKSAAAALFLVLLVVAIQVYSGAYRSDFSYDDDEAGHAVCSLAVHDYIVHGFPHNPVRFAERFYIHYPKVAIGHWPPLFYASEAAWMLIFGRTRGAMIAFLAVLSIALIVSVFLWVRRDYGTGAGLIAAIVLTSAQFMQSAMAVVAPNIALGLLAFWAAILLGEYLDSRRRRDIILFIAVVGTATGMHGRGAALALMPFALLATGRVRFTRARILMLTGVMGLMLVVPGLLGQARKPDILDIPRLAGLYLYRCCVTMSWPAVILAAAGAYFVIRRSSKPRRWLAMPALALSGWVFHSLVNANWGDRYLVTAAPAIAALAGAGYHFVTNTIAGRPILKGAAVVLLGAGLAWVAIPLLRKADSGYHRMAPIAGSIDLIAGDAVNEGAYISESALRDPGLERIVMRGSKMLASSTWTGQNYTLRFSNPDEVLAFLDRARVTAVLVQKANPRPDVALLAQAVTASSQWREIHPQGEPPGVAVFERTAPLPPGKPEIRIDMRYSLGRTLELQP